MKAVLNRDYNLVTVGSLKPGGRGFINPSFYDAATGEVNNAAVVTEFLTDENTLKIRKSASTEEPEFVWVYPGVRI